MSNVINTQMNLQRRVIDAVEPFRGVLHNDVIRKLAMAEVTAWINDQDDSIDPARIVEHARAAKTFIDRTF